MAMAAIIAVISFTIPGYISTDSFTTAEQRPPGTSMDQFSETWSTGQHLERRFTDSPLIEWTFFQKTNDVYESSDSSTQNSDSSLGSYADSGTTEHYQYDYYSDDSKSSNTDPHAFYSTNEEEWRETTNSEPKTAYSETRHFNSHSSHVISESSTQYESVTPNVDSSTVSQTTVAETHYADSTLGSSGGISQDLSTSSPKFTDCVYDVSRTSGEIIFPDNLPRANSSEVLTCKWRVRTPVGPNIKLHFRKLELELGSEYLELAVGMARNKATRLITGTKLPADIIVKGTELWLTLKSRQKDGFTQVSLEFEETNENSTFPVSDNTTCGGLLVDMEGNVSSPGYPDRNYSTNEECTWYIAAPAHSVIQMSIMGFKTEVYDQVRIGVGLLAKAPTSRLLTLFGDLVHERETIVPANSLWINFYSDDTITAKGFFIRYKIIPRAICNTSNVFDSESGAITSVNYPKPYPINSECTWTIAGQPGSYINMTFHDLRIQDGRDFVLVGQGKEVFDGPFTTYTGNITRSFTLTVKASNAWLHFTSDHLMGGDGYRGFNISFSVFEKDLDEQPTTPRGVRIEDNYKLDQVPRKDVLIFRLTGVQKEQFESRLTQFRTELTRVVNERCQANPSCKDSDKPLRTEDVEVTSLTNEGDQLVVEVLVRTALVGDYAMDSLDYEELEKLFHSDLQTLDLQHGPGGAEGGEESRLPEWLIGVIVVVILLIVVFFAMVIYSLVKERKKQRAGSYGGNTSSASMCDEVEVGKDDGNIRITSFIVDNEKNNGNGWVDTEASTLQRRPQAGIHGCMNPAYVDDEEQGKTKSADKKKDHKPKENGKETSDSDVREKAVDVEPQTDNEDNEVDIKTTTPSIEIKTEQDPTLGASTSKTEIKTVETQEAEVKDADNTISLDADNQTRKDSSSDSCNSDKGDNSDLSTNL
ncbi:uncharacterized protein [Haliotis cracherodii]|uniref:uncharacterized protein n=1 Tax=Haliotis cracherodii TaxID=6455 RepID=UPI0039E85E80